MTREEINKAISECLGWKWYRRPATGAWAKSPMRCLYHPELMKPLALELADMTERECNYAFMEREGLVSDYFSNLNACALMEETLTHEERSEYVDHLLHILCKVDSGYVAVLNSGIRWLLATPTAPQRCQAFLRTKGKWVD